MFSESDRLVYRFHNGTKEVAADPLVVRRQLLQASGGEFWSLLAAAHEPGPPGRPEGEAGTGTAGAPTPESTAVLMTALDSQEKVLACVRQAFGLAAFDPDTGDGCTEAMAWKVVDDYIGMLEKKDTRGEPSPTSSESTGSPQASS